jgi:hypothetical protein
MDLLVTFFINISGGCRIWRRRSLVSPTGFSVVDLVGWVLADCLRNNPFAGSIDSGRAGRCRQIFNDKMLRGNGSCEYHFIN